MTTRLDSSDTERELREALSARARQVHPSSRLDAILREAAQPEQVQGRRRGLTFVAVAAAAAAVAGVVWVARPAPEGPPPRPAGTATVTPTPTAAPTGEGTPTPTSSPPVVSSAVAVARYSIGTNAGPGSRPCLVRTFTSASWSTDASPSERILATARSLLASSPLWDGVSVERADVTASRIVLDLTGPGEALGADEARLALRSLAWTAQAQHGDGDVPVAVRVQGGGGLFGQAVPATLTRAGTPPESVCDIWIDHPAPDLTLAPGSLVASGQAVAFEASVDWELSRGATVVRDGFTTASAGGPARGTFLIDLGRLEPGTWVLRAFTTSAKDGRSVVAERRVTFTVR